MQFNHFFKTAVRHFTQNKMNAAINVVGLAAGMVGLLLAVLYWLDERSFDSFHAKKNQIFRVTTSQTDRETGAETHSAGTGQVQAAAFKEAAPEILQTVRLLGGDIFGGARVGEKTLRLQMLFADDAFFEMFDFPLLCGDRATALKEINSVVLSEETALRFFGKTDVAGQTIMLDANPSAEKLGHKPSLITGVARKLPASSSIQFDMLLPMRFIQLSFEDKNWLNSYLGTFLLLDKKADKLALLGKFQRVFDEKAAPQIAEQGFDPKMWFGLQNLADIHLDPIDGDGGESGWNESGVVGGSRPFYSNLFLAIAFFVFLLACINFVNISIAASLKRAKEVSVRKINGGSRTAILGQFFGESALLCGLAFGLAVAALGWVLPFFNEILDKKFSLTNAFDGRMLAGFAAVLVATAAFSGLYPAILMSNFSPLDALRSRNQPIGQHRLGRGLVVFQFGLAVVLLVSTTVFYQQMAFIQSKKLGYEPRHVLHTRINGDREFFPIRDFLRNEVARSPLFAGIAFGGTFNSNNIPATAGGKKIGATYFGIDSSYLRLMGIKLAAGQNFTSEKSREVIVNRAFLQAFGLKNPLGESVFLDKDYSDGDAPFRIVGVAEDFHFESLKSRVQPALMYPINYHSEDIWLKINHLSQKEAVAAFEKIYQTAMPGAVFEHDFLEDLNTRQYDRERRWQKIIGAATALAVAICCLGLFGLSHLAAARRTKEIGIRKTLGASVAQVAGLLTKDFLKLVVAAVFIASPVAYFFMKKWLAGFAYSVEIGWWFFVPAALAAVAVAFLTVGFQAVKAAMADPVKSLRSE